MKVNRVYSGDTQEGAGSNPVAGHFARLAQSVEAAHSKSVGSQFESEVEHMDMERAAKRGRVMAKVHLVAAVIWLLLFIPTVIWWSQSILWVLFVSLYANVVSHIGAYQASRAEVVGATNP